MHSKKTLIQYIQQSMHPAYQKASIDAIQAALKINYKLNEVPEIGSSKFGGYPDFSRDLDWPIDKKGIPYLFLAQINLSEIQSYDLTYPIPQKGILYFFAEVKYPYAFDVLYSDGSKPLKQRRPLPKEAENISFWSLLLKQKNYFKTYPIGTISFEQTYTIPYYSSLYYSQLELEGRLGNIEGMIADEQVYFENLFGEQVVNHHLFGDYQVVQNERIESNLEGYKLNFKRLNKKDLPAIKASMDWILFLQLDTDNALEFYFGDAGKTYFFIKKQDLLKGDFSKIKGYWDTH
ncbi:MAG: DUF1963 domain-containing protein [Aureispira sp.]|nr:DUF1963 domain-containing protein [Aureispira sp.]